MSVASVLEPNKPRAPVELVVNGTVLNGFERGDLQLSMIEGANTFSVEYVPDPANPSARQIFRGDAVEVWLDAGDGHEKVLDGYVDQTEEDDDPDALRLSASGRSKTCDLIDCSVASTRSWKDAKLIDIVSDLCAPFDISTFVVGSPDTEKITFSARGDEGAFAAISRVALMRGMFAYCTGGDLVLARAGSSQTKTVLERGVNIERTRRTESWYDRFSEYIFRAQSKADDDDSDVAENAQLKHSVTDTTITRYRPLCIQVEAGGQSTMEHRAIIERNVRAGQSEAITTTFDGWGMTERTGKLVAWRPNTLVRFKNPLLGVDADLIVVTARFRFGARERQEVELTLARPEAFSLANYPPLGRTGSMVTALNTLAGNI